MRRVVTILVIAVTLSCGVSDNVVEDRRIRSGGNGKVIHEVRTDRYGWERVSSSEYKDCKKGAVFHVNPNRC